MAYFGNIEELTIQNINFRQVLFTGSHLQLVVMSLKPGEEIGKEKHDTVDQFFRIEEGEAKFIINDSEEYVVKEDGIAIIPAGTWHNIINTSQTEELKLYTIYSPPNHPDKTIHKTKLEADEAEHEH